MLVIFLIAAAGIAILFAVRFRIVRSAGPSSPRALFTAGLLEFAIPFAAVALILSIAEWWLARAANAVTATNTIRELEQTLRFIRTFILKPLMAPAWLQVLAALALLGAAFIWPVIRARQILQAYKTAMKWIGRAYIFATMLACFTFFGGYVRDDVRVTEARLASAIDEIDREYGAVQEEIEGTLAEAAARELVQAAVFAPVVRDIEAVAQDARAEQTNIREARAKLARSEHLSVRDFALTVESKAVYERLDLARPSRTPRRVSIRDQRSMATAAEARAAVREARVSSGLPPTVTRTVGELTVDAAHEGVAKILLGTLFADSPLRGLLEIALDPNVAYNFREQLAAKAEDTVARSIQQRPAFRDAILRRMAEVRVWARNAAPALSAHLRAALVPAAEKLRARVEEARNLPDMTASQLRQLGEAQYRRELQQFREDWSRRYALANPELDRAGDVLRLRLEPSANDGIDPLAKVAAIRRLRAEAQLDGMAMSAVAAVQQLVALEAAQGFAREFKSTLDARVDELIRSDRLSRWGWLRHEAALLTQDRAAIDVTMKEFAAAYEGWQQEQRRFALEQVVAGTAQEVAWEARFRDYCVRNTEMAVAWGWTVKDMNSREIESRYGEAVPEYGLRYYLEQIGERNARMIADGVYSKPEVERRVTQICNRG